MSENYERFKATLAKHYVELFKTPEYALNASRRTPEQAADKMVRALLVGEANKDGEGIKRTCKELGIKQTYKAINEYIK